MQRINLDNRKKAIEFLNNTGWDAMLIENTIHSGTPDLNAAKVFKHTASEIWIKFEIVKTWPKRAVTAIKIKHFSVEHRNWFKLRIKHNPNCFIIIQIEEELFLYRVTHDVITNLGINWNKEIMIDKCLAVRIQPYQILADLERRLKDIYIAETLFKQLNCL